MLIELFSLAEKFADAFNRRDVNALGDLLCSDATAEVVGSGWPEEQGRAAILATSIPHIMDEGTPLAAEARHSGDGVFVLLRRKNGGELDTVLRCQSRDGKISRLDYLVTGFCRAEMARLAEPLGIPLCRDDE